MAAKQALMPEVAVRGDAAADLERAVVPRQAREPGSGVTTARGEIPLGEIARHRVRHLGGRSDARDRGLDLLGHGDEERDLRPGSRLVARSGTRLRVGAASRARARQPRLVTGPRLSAAMLPGSARARRSSPAPLCRSAQSSGSCALPVPACRDTPVQPPARGRERKRPRAGARAAREAARDARAQAIEPRAAREEGPEREARRDSGAGDRWRSNSRSRQWRIILGSGILIGQTLSQRPQKVEALGRWPASSMPMSVGVSTAAHGPGIDPAIGVAADRRIDRAMIEAGGAADAAQHVLELGAEHRGAAVVEQHDVELARGRRDRPAGAARSRTSCRSRIPGPSPSAPGAAGWSRRPRGSARSSRCSPARCAPGAGSESDRHCPRW